MIVLIALLVGISDIAALVALVGVNAAMIGFGWLQERYEAPGAGLGPFWIGCIAGIIPWIAITIYLVGPDADTHPPGFVYGIFFSLFVAFNCFAVNQWLQYKQLGKWKDYLVGERCTSPCPSSPRACSRGRSSPPPSPQAQRTKRHLRAYGARANADAMPDLV